MADASTTGPVAGLRKPAGSDVLRDAIKVIIAEAIDKLNAAFHHTTGHHHDGIDSRKLDGAVINVKEFDAKGDGLTDDTAAIQAAIDATAAVGGTVVIPAGTYMVSSYLAIPSNISLVGMGWASILKATNKTLYPNLHAAYPTEPDGSSSILFVKSNAENVHISNLQLQGVWASGGSTTTNNIYIGTGTKNCSVHDCFSYNAGWSGIFTKGFGHSIYNNHCANCAIDGIEVQGPGGELRIWGNYLEGNGLATTPGIGNFEACTGAGTTLVNVAFFGNTLKGGNRGVCSTSGNVGGLSITGNQFIGPFSEIAIYLGGPPLYNVTIEGNTLEGNGGAHNGIDVVNLSGFMILGNNVRGLSGASASGIVIRDDSLNGVVACNYVADCVVGLAMIANCDYISAFGNRAHDNISNNFAYTTTGAHNKLFHNVERATEDGGMASIVSGGIIYHLLESTPSQYSVTATVAGHIVAVTGVATDALTISIVDHAGTPITVAENVNWRAWL